MRLIHTLTLVIAITFYASSDALPAIKDSNGMIKKAATPDIVDSIDAGRQLRSDYSGGGEERHFGNADDERKLRSDYSGYEEERHFGEP
ncbi:hypothetical protein PHMEG_00031433 [Phytophthora megakarya]|uniref:RxLR effector protein n=1 Tax=Phytophthora megakarya TaxID=4795 RepID=A0A225UYB8_9STRA|nr:hypothetical protein PHMEG_00031433 [Phytophthora megakarya]